MNSMLLHAKNIKKSFIKDKLEIPVIRGIDLIVNAGERVAITGSSGVGKSTLLHILGTLEKPTSGELIWGHTGQNILKLSERGIADFRNRALGFIFQFHYLLPEFSALENVMMPGLIAGEPRPGLEKNARELLEFVGLSHRLTHRPTELSGGEQQRVAIARSLILKPKLILADELTGNLDSENSRNVMELLLGLNEQTGVSILLVTHDAHIASQMHRVITVKDGLILSEERGNSV